MKCTAIRRGAALLLLLCSWRVPLLGVDAPPPGSADYPPVPGDWERIPLALPEPQITRLLITRDRLVWIGTTNGLAVYDGARVHYPSFLETEKTALIVRDLYDLGNETVLVGTINGSLWRATPTTLQKLVDLGDRSEHSFARLQDGRLLIANSFGRLRPEDLADARLPPFEVLPFSVDFMATAGTRLYLASLYGRVEMVDLTKQEPQVMPVADLALSNAEPLRSFTTGPSGRLLVGTDEGFYRISPAVTQGRNWSFEKLRSGACRAAREEPGGRTWLGCADGLFLLEGPGSPLHWDLQNVAGLSLVSALATDSEGNLWVGSDGLFRYSDYFRRIDLGAQNGTVAALSPDGADGFFVGMKDGTALQVNAAGGTQSLEVGSPYAPTTGSFGGYYPGALLARGRDGTTWILNHNGLFKHTHAATQKIAEYPLAEGEIQGSPAVSIAVSDRGEVFCSRIWVPAIHRWDGRQWSTARTMPTSNGGSSVFGLAFDATGTLWAATTERVMALRQGRWLDSEPIPHDPEAKKSLNGSLTYLPSRHTVLVSGPWGYSIWASISGNGIAWRRALGNGSEAGRASTNRPAYFRSVIDHPLLGPLAATSTGLLRLRNGSWDDFDLGDPRLESGPFAMAAGADSTFWIDNGYLWRVLIPVHKPVLLAAPLPAVLRQGSLRIPFTVRSLAGRSTLRIPDLQFEPSGPTVTLARDEQHFVVGGLRDGVNYHYHLQVTDAFGTRSDPLQGNFRVSLPWHESPAKVALIIAASLFLMAILLVRRGPIGFLLRTLLGRRWHFEPVEVDLVVEIERDREHLSFRLETPTRQATVVPRVTISLPAETLHDLREECDAVAKTVPFGNLPSESYAAFSARLETIAQRLYSLLPETVRFCYEQTTEGSLQLILDDGLLDLPWELWQPAGRRCLALERGVGRLVASRELASRNREAPRELRALLFAPSGDKNAGQLRQTHREIAAVTRRVHRWGGKVTTLAATAKPEDLLKCLPHFHLFHYVGHAHFDPETPEGSYLPLQGGARVTAQEIQETLSRTIPRLFLAFINGCGSGRERPWSGARAAFGLASPFLRGSAYFIGAQWPVPDAFSWEFADLFYREIFPTSRLQLWRWLQRSRLAGIGAGEALRRAREGLHGRTYASSTWPAYVYYGDPSVQLSLE